MPEKNQLTVNGTTVEYSNVSLIRWVSGSDDDSIDVVTEGEARFVVVDCSRPDRPPRPGRGDSTPPTEMLAETDRERNRRPPLPGQAPTGRLADLDEAFADTGETPPHDWLTPQRGRRGGSGSV